MVNPTTRTSTYGIANQSANPSSNALGTATAMKKATAVAISVPARRAGAWCRRCSGQLRDSENEDQIEEELDERRALALRRNDGPSHGFTAGRTSPLPPSPTSHWIAWRPSRAASGRVLGSGAFMRGKMRRTPSVRE
ncbi:MAG: hypothetical protein OEN56_07980 [Gemmatimonadota bacterium]|nr:hypothetical protein [Gemmatimonadota bacterium]MDH3423831.1 hypothetical protein [Gemmatimonadota bacterium]